MNIILNHIKVQNDTLEASLRAICEFQTTVLENEADDDSITIDLKNVSFISPLWIACVLNFLPIKDIVFINIPQYLRQIRFNTPFAMKELDTIKEDYANKTYIPIIQFATNGSCDERDLMVSIIEELIVNKTNIQQNIITAIKYLFSEMTDNILEHSESTYGYVVSQFYPQKQFVDIAIADNGKGLLNSYLKHNFPIQTEEEAMRAVNARQSTKERPNAENRGYGIYTTKHILKGLGGEFSMLSGQIVYHLTKSSERYLKLPEPISIQGTVVLLRIPCSANINFNLLNYLE